MTELEYRIVCAHFGTSSRHTSHKFDKKGKDRKRKAKQSVIEANHQAEMTTDGFYSNEAPYRVQTREVSAWADDE